MQKKTLEKHVNLKVPKNEIGQKIHISNSNTIPTNRIKQHQHK